MAAELTLTQTNLFVGGQGGYHTYRIPALVVTRTGTLLAFCEGRKKGAGDAGDIDLLMRRSTDGGKTWSGIQVIRDDGPNTVGNPCPVVDMATGTVHLLMTHNLGQDREPQIIDGTSVGTRTVWTMRSEDNGLTWSPPQDITATTKPANWTWYATGPGNGIQLRSGRLVIPCDHMEAGTKKAYSHVIYSDDHGQTWKLGGTTPDDRVNECAVIQRRDGTLLLNMRNYGSNQRNRAVATSADEGLTWSAVTHDATLIEPICQASLIRIPGQGQTDHVLFSNPASQQRREKMTVRLSYDEGKTWPVSRIIHAGSAAYSCLATGADQSVFCLYENGDRSPYEKITLAHFPMGWLNLK